MEWRQNILLFVVCLFSLSTFLFLSFFHHNLIIYCCIAVFMYSFSSSSSYSLFILVFFSVFPPPLPQPPQPPPPPTPPPTLHRSPHVGVISCFSPQCFLPLVLLHIWPSLSVPRCVFFFFYFLLFTCKETIIKSWVKWVVPADSSKRPTHNRLSQYIIRETVMWLSLEGCWGLLINRYQSPLFEHIYRVSFNTI